MSEQPATDKAVALDPAVERRILAAANFEEPDRVPIWDLIDNRGALEHFAPGETDVLKASVALYRALGIDLCRGFSGGISETEEGTTVGDPGKERQISGRTVWNRPPIESLDDLQAYNITVPEKEHILQNWVPEMRRLQTAFAPHTMFVPGADTGFNLHYGLMKLELFCYALQEAPAHVERLLEAQGEAGARYAEAAAETRLTPIFFTYDDIAYKDRLMFSPALLRRTFVRMLKRMCDILHGAGIKVIFHSDGNLMEILDDMLDAGIDGLNPIEPLAGMDIGLLKRRYGRRLILVGNVDCSQVLPLGSPDDVVEATKACIRAASPGGGHFIGSSSEIVPSTPLENIIAFYEAIHRYGRDPITC
jgi:uroporphyrinogen decarboxylase